MTTTTADTIDWPGASNKKYKYWFMKRLEPAPGEIKAEPGNYMFVKRQANGWVPVYIGQTGNLRNRLASHPEIACVKQNNGTHLMAHTSGDGEQTRKTEESNLIAKWNPPCNQQGRTQ